MPIFLSVNYQYLKKIHHDTAPANSKILRQIVHQASKSYTFSIKFHILSNLLHKTELLTTLIHIPH
jgi:hypothetical protein